MSLDDALFLVDRAGTNYHCKGYDLKTKLQIGDKILVQRGTEHFHTWYGKPSYRDTAYYTRRVRFNNQCFPNAAGDANDQHTDQPGEVNLSYWWGCGGPSPIREWRNIRNKNVSGFVDLDGEPFPLQRNSDIVEGSICRITSDAGWSSWHEIDFKGANDGIGFQTQYTNDAGDRERTDLKVEGVENTYKPANGEILTFDFFDDLLDPFSDIEDNDLILAWDGTKNRKVKGKNFRPLYKDIDPWLDVKLVYVETLCDRGDIRFTTTGIPNGYFDYPDSPTGLARIKSYIDDWYLDGVNQGRMDYIASPTLYIANVDTAPTGAEVVGGVRLQLVAVQPNGTDALPIRQRIELSAPVINTCTPISDDDLAAKTEEAESCHREAYQDYLGCKLLCETAYCQSICDSQYEEAVNECYQTRGLAVPARITPPPLA